MQVNNVFITGIKGFIGSNLAEYLQEPDFYVDGCDNKGDILGDFIEQYYLGNEYDVVVHTAGLVSVPESEVRPADYIRENLTKLALFLDHNPEVKIVFLSTGGAIYGDSFNAKEGEASIKSCKSIYAATKLMAEHLVMEHSSNNLILRLGVVMGDEDNIRSVPNVFTHFSKDDPIIVYGNGQVRDFINVKTVCEAIKRGIEKDLSGIYNIGSGKGTDIDLLALDYAKKRDVKVKVHPKRECEVNHITLDISQAKKVGLL